jgi:hypothetical protein
VKAERHIKSILSKADLATATSPRTVDYWQSLHNGSKYEFIPNGYDEADFPEPSPQPERTVGIYGTINHLIGPERLIDWLAEFQRTRPELRFCLKHTGYIEHPGFNRRLAAAGLDGVWRSEGYLPHSQSIASIRKNRLNLLSLNFNCDTSFIVPSKLFELLRAEPPLVAILPKENAARRLLEQHNFPKVDIVDNSAAFSDCLSRYLSGSEAKDPDRRPGVEIFELRQQCERIANLTAEL